MTVVIKSFEGVALFSRLLIILVFFTTCSTPRGVLNDRTLNSYDWESRPLHPEFKVYHQSNDSSTFWLMVHSSELLYARSSPDASFEGRVGCSVRIQQEEGADFVDVDSIQMQVIDENPNKESRFVIANETFKLDTTGVYRFLIEVKDLNRRWEEQSQLIVHKHPYSTREDYLIYRNGQDIPFPGDDLRAGDEVKVVTERGEKLMRHLTWDPDIGLPPPPYADARLVLPEPPATQGKSFIANGLPFETTEGLLSITDNNGLHLFTMRVHNDPFPKVETINTMIASLRYISSRREFELITGSKYPKKELDKFWLDCGGSKDRTRELIRIYYNRVQEANYYFSSIIDGWKTDRGLIHVIFGNPSRIRSSSDYETWVYGEENHLSSIVFNFKKIKTPFSRNHYQLERNPLYRTEWDRAVTAWRNGRIFQE